MDFKFEDLTLANAAGGRAEELFQEALEEVLDVAANRHRMSGDKDGQFRAKVVVELEFTMSNDPDNDTKSMSVAVGVRRPKRKAVGCAVHMKDGHVLTQPGLEQTKLFTIDGKKGERA